jgi:hypothetical protein
MKTYVTDVTIVLKDCPTSGNESDMVDLLKSVGLEDITVKECVITGYINSFMIDALRNIEHIRYVRTGNNYYIDVDNPCADKLSETGELSSGFDAP